MSKPILERSLTICRENPWLQQFGQSGDFSTLNGALGCTHTILQLLLMLWHGQRMTHDEISSVAEFPFPARNPTRRGLRNTEVETFVRRLDLPYEWAYALTPSQILQGTLKAPVLLGVRYKDWPAAKSQGVPPRNGWRNGNASRYGADQPFGFDGGHAVAALGYQTVGGQVIVYAKEPNHGSPSRPKRPDYDTMTTAQFYRAAKSWRSLYPAGTTYALIPTKTL
jgi:hypothetical protein